MTPLQLAREECANWENGEGRCSKIIIQENGTMVRRPTMPDLCALKTGQRCQYFEDTILPMIPHLEASNAIRAKYKSECLEAEHQYRMETGAMMSKPTGKCACGKPREYRHKFCSECAQKRRQETMRAANLKRGVTSTTI